MKTNQLLFFISILCMQSFYNVSCMQFKKSDDFKGVEKLFSGKKHGKQALRAFILQELLPQIINHFNNGELKKFDVMRLEHFTNDGICQVRSLLLLNLFESSKGDFSKLSNDNKSFVIASFLRAPCNRAFLERLQDKVPGGKKNKKSLLSSTEPQNIIFNSTAGFIFNASDLLSEMLYSKIGNSITINKKFSAFLTINFFISPKILRNRVVCIDCAQVTEGINKKNVFKLFFKSNGNSFININRPSNKKTPVLVISGRSFLSRNNDFSIEHFRNFVTGIDDKSEYNFKNDRDKIVTALNNMESVNINKTAKQFLGSLDLFEDIILPNAAGHDCLRNNNLQDCKDILKLPTYFEKALKGFCFDDMSHFLIHHIFAATIGEL